MERKYTPNDTIFVLVNRSILNAHCILENLSGRV